MPDAALLEVVSLDASLSGQYKLIWYNLIIDISKHNKYECINEFDIIINIII